MIPILSERVRQMHHVVRLTFFLFRVIGLSVRLSFFSCSIFGLTFCSRKRQSCQMGMPDGLFYESPALYLVLPLIRSLLERRHRGCMLSV